MQTEQELNITITGEQKELVIRHGDAEQIVYPQKVDLQGDIRSVGSFLRVRRKDAAGSQEVDVKKAVVIISRSEPSILLLLDPESNKGANIKGVLRKSPDLLEWCINTRTTFKRAEFRELVKFNKRQFVDKQVYTDLMLQLGKLNSNVTYVKGESEDDRGNREDNFVRTVTSNIMDGFKLELPIYENFEEETIDVEIVLGVKDGALIFSLASVQLAELLEVKRDQILAAQLEEASDLVTIYK